MPDPNRLLDVGEVAILLHTSGNTVRRLVDQGYITAQRLSDIGRRRVTVANLQAYAEKQCVTLDWSLLNHRQ